MRGFSAVLLLILITLIAGFSGYFYLNFLKTKDATGALKTSVSSRVAKEEITFKMDVLPETNFKSYAVQTRSGGTEKSFLTLVPLETQDKTPIVTAIESGGLEAASGLGQTGPVTSDDFTRSALVKDHRLWIISSDGKLIVKTPEDIYVQYLTQWSPNSRKLIIYSGESVGMGEASPIPSPANAKPLLPFGFYLLDTRTGEGKLIPDLKNLQAWIGDNKILTYLDENALRPEAGIYDLNTLTIDIETLRGKFKDYFGRQFSFSSDGKKWGISLGNTEGNSVTGDYGNIIYANFPSLDGKIIEEGTWASPQSPFISPSGKRLAYIKSFGTYDQIYYWNGEKIQYVGKGQIEKWLNDNQLIVREFDYSHPELGNQYFIYDLSLDRRFPLY